MRFAVLAVAILGPLLVGPAVATEHSACPKRMTFKKIAPLRMTAVGAICPGVSDDFFQAVLDAQEFPSTLLLWSPGGNVHAALEFGRLIRAMGINTEVMGPCESSCTLVAIGGVRRSISREAFFGVHQFYSERNIDGAEALSIAQLLAADIAQYVEDMGVDAAFYREAARHTGRDTKILSREMLRRYRVINNEPGRALPESLFSPQPLIGR